MKGEEYWTLLDLEPWKLWALAQRQSSPVVPWEVRWGGSAPVASS